MGSEAPVEFVSEPVFDMQVFLIENIDQLIDNVRELATKYPHAIYRKPGFDDITVGSKSVCQYGAGTVTNGPPDADGCIVGLAAKMIKPEFQAALHKNACGINGLLNRALNYYIAVHYSKLTDLNNLETALTPKREWLKLVQEAQDSGLSWGESLNYADATMKKEQASNNKETTNAVT